MPNPTANVQQLKMLGLPVIQTLDDFSFLTHISKYTIFQLSKNSAKYYRTFGVLKKSGKTRIIAEPSRKLKGLQAWILVNILNRLKVSDSCFGFEKGSSIVDNARMHVGANIIINFDLNDFFPSVHVRRVYSIFRSIGYNTLISTILTNLTTFQSGLPQGAPTSPKLANLVLWKLDARIQGYVGKKGIVFTRYADDLTFSGIFPNRVCKIIPTVKKIIEDEGFSLNDRKTRIAGTSKAKKVTGLIVNENSVGVGKKVYKLLRAKIHYLSKLETEAGINSTDGKNLFLHIKGWLSYLNSVDPTRYRRTRIYIQKLLVKSENDFLQSLMVTTSHSVNEN